MRPEKGRCFFVELTNPQWQTGILGKRLEELVKTHQKGDPVTLTLQARETFRLSGETRDRLSVITWAINPGRVNGITVNNDQPHAGQHTLEFPMANIQPGDVTNATTLATDNAGSSFPQKSSQ